MAEQQYISNKPLRVLVVACNYPPFYDGISVFTQNLVEQLTNIGHTVELLNFGDREYSFANLQLRDFWYTKATAHPYYSLPSILNPLNLTDCNRGLRNFVFTNLVSRITNQKIVEFKPDVMHLTYTRLFSALTESTIPSVITLHSEEVVDQYPVHHALEQASHVHSVSRYTAELAHTIRSISKEKSAVINNSISVTNYRQHTSRKKQIVSIGRLSREKNFDTAIRAFHQLPEKIRSEYRYVIIGNGNERGPLQELINQLGLNDRVVLTGGIREEEKQQYLAESELFLLCPRIKKGEQEGFGIVYLEAQASGLPIVASNIGGITEAVEDAGIYIDNPEDPEAIAQGITRVLSDTNLYHQLQNSGKLRVHAFDHSKWVHKIENLYQLVIQQ
ncbi:MAG: glycosyltransferase family 4 protein [Patescibacteria group bacterium]